jgi:uncharacterized protein YjbJ (UPF0337 family)
VKSITKNQAKGKFHEVRGTIREIAGKISDKSDLEAEGIAEKIAGQIQNKIGQAEKILGK